MSFTEGMSSSLSASTVRASVGSRKAQKARTRQALLDAGRAAFAEVGYARTTIGDIASRAGVAGGTVYVHFADGKEELADALLAEFNEALARRLAPILQGSSEASLEARVRAAAEAFLDHWDAHRDLVSTYVERSTSGVSLEGMRDGVNPPAAELLRATLASARGATATGGAAPDLLAHAVLAMWLRVGLQYLYVPHVTREAALTTLVRATVGAVRAVLFEEVSHAS
jgi:AcrR family transcriptional regulator